MKIKLKIMAWSVAGFLCMAYGASEILSANNHRGSGIVDYENGSALESEAQYKRHHYTIGGMAVVIGAIFGWCSFCVERENQSSNESQAGIDYLISRLKQNEAYSGFTEEELIAEAKEIGDELHARADAARKRLKERGFKF